MRVCLGLFLVLGTGHCAIAAHLVPASSSGLRLLLVLLLLSLLLVVGKSGHRRGGASGAWFTRP